MTVSTFRMTYMQMGYTVARVALIAVVFALLSAAPAQAHPLGNFSVNHLSTVSVSDDRVEVRYVLDQAEIPTVQERGLGRAEVLRRKLGEVRHGLTHGRRARSAAARLVSRTSPSPPAPAGSRPHAWPWSSMRSFDAERVTLRDATFPGRVGWKAIVAAPGEGTAVRTKAPSGDPTNGLRSYPNGLLDTPADRTEATFSVTSGNGVLVAPLGEVAARRRRAWPRLVAARRTRRASHAPTASPPCSRTPPRAAACSSCCSWRRSAGAPFTRCLRAAGREGDGRGVPDRNAGHRP